MRRQMLVGHGINSVGVIPAGRNVRHGWRVGAVVQVLGGNERTCVHAHGSTVVITIPTGNSGGERPA